MMIEWWRGKVRSLSSPYNTIASSSPKNDRQQKQHQDEVHQRNQSLWTTTRSKYEVVAISTRKSAPSSSLTVTKTSSESTKSEDGNDYKLDEWFDEQQELESSMTTTKATTTFPLMAFVISSSIVSSIIIITVPFIVLPFTLKQTLPYMATPKHKIKDALLFIQQHSFRKRQQQQQYETMQLRNADGCDDYIHFNSIADVNLDTNGSNQSATSLSVCLNTTSLRSNDHRPEIRKRQPQQEYVNQFLDLGSGDGETVYQALKISNATTTTSTDLVTATTRATNGTTANDGNEQVYSQYYFTSCIGMELNTTLYAYSYLRRFLFWEKQQQVRSRFLCRNIFPKTNSNLLQPNGNHNSSSYLIHRSNVIMIFGIPSLMIPFSRLLYNSHCRPGTYIICYRFPLPVTTVATSNSMNIPPNSGKTSNKAITCNTNISIGNNKNKSNDLLELEEHLRNNNQNRSSLSSLLSAQLIYNKEEMRVYECIQPTTCK